MVENAKLAVLGSPIAHSKSPQFHLAAYHYLHLDSWEYQAIELQEAGFDKFVDSLDSQWRGLSVTMPLKGMAYAKAAVLSDTARHVGAVNTLYWKTSPELGAIGQPSSATRTLHGDNTDVSGLVRAFQKYGYDHLPSGGVLGGGATAASAVAALQRLGVESPEIYIRSERRIADLSKVADRLGVSPVFLPWDSAAQTQVAALISTVPPHAADGLAEALQLPTRDAVLLDVAYDPWPSRLAHEWSTGGGEVISGLEMLLFQAVEQVKLFTADEKIDTTALYTVMKGTLSAAEQSQLGLGVVQE